MFYEHAVLFINMQYAAVFRSLLCVAHSMRTPFVLLRIEVDVI